MTNDATTRVRLADVARRAGVSVATASRVLNNTGGNVAAEFRNRVLEAAATLGYGANPAAQAIVTGRYPAIGLVVGDVRDQYFSRVAYGVMQEASTEDLPVIIVSADDDAMNEVLVIARMRRQRVRSLVFVRKRDSSPQTDEAVIQQLNAFEAEGGRVVVVGESTRPTAAIRPPDFDGAKLLGQELIALGYRDFAAFAPEFEVPSARDRLDGFRAALSAAGIALPDSRVFRTESATGGGAVAAQAYLRSAAPSELIFCLEDVIALGAIAEFRRSGMRVPGDVAVAGYGGRRFEGLGTSADDLTTVRSPLEEMGAAAVAMTRPAGARDNSPQVHPEILIRRTTPPRGTRPPSDTVAA
jgi:LacI family transcriptional regulator